MVGADVVRAPRTHSTLMALLFMLIVKYTHCHRKRGGGYSDNYRNCVQSCSWGQDF